MCVLGVGETSDVMVYNIKFTCISFSKAHMYWSNSFDRSLVMLKLLVFLLVKR